MTDELVSNSFEWIVVEKIPSSVASCCQKCRDTSKIPTLLGQACWLKGCQAVIVSNLQLDWRIPWQTVIQRLALQQPGGVMDHKSSQKVWRVVLAVVVLVCEFVRFGVGAAGGHTRTRPVTQKTHSSSTRQVRHTFLKFHYQCWYFLRNYYTT